MDSEWMKLGIFLTRLLQIMLICVDMMGIWLLF